MTHPDLWLKNAVAELEHSGRRRLLRQRRLSIDAPWLHEGAIEHLNALYLIESTESGPRLRALVTERPIAQPAAEGGEETTFTEEAARLGAAIVDLDAPLALEPVSISKPWGRELWYTGIEKRGLSRVCSDTGSTPLPWVLALAPHHLCHGTPPVLLKILDPSAQPVLGDLYIEMHERKREVYVVVQVDREAWPGGTGGIRLGIAPEQRRRIRDDDALRAAFLAAVEDYERVRRQIDAIFEDRRVRSGLDAGAAVSPMLLQRWHAELPDALQAEEARRRSAMESFLAFSPLRVGDVVSIPVGVPHSLQHGVRVVEFQTPVYERKIIAFAQKVQTQDHWDSAEAIGRMSLEEPGPTNVTVTAEDADCTVENIASFHEFNAWRIRLAAGSRITLPSHVPYALCMTVQGQIRCGTLSLAAEEACFVPGRGPALELRNAGSVPALCLIAAPGL